MYANAETQKAHFSESMLSELTCTVYNGIDTSPGHSLLPIIQLKYKVPFCAVKI